MTTALEASSKSSAAQRCAHRRCGNPQRKLRKSFPASRQKPYLRRRGTGIPGHWSRQAMNMAQEQVAANAKQPTVIKKYANRRLYNTGTSAYVTLEDLAHMVKRGEDFVVLDAKTGEDITRSVLTQIIFEQEGKVGQSMLPITFLRQLIRFYGDSMQMLVPSYLEFSIDKFTNEQQKFRDQITNAFGGGP